MIYRNTMSRGVLYALFVLSGVAGLIYESIWSHYLKLFLGHAAYAQTLVLTIFMGGMAIGAWLAGDIARRASRPLLWYVAIEALLGVAGLGFDPLFRGMQVWVFDSVIPGASSPLAVDFIKWSLSALIILPQSILLGATFPMMSAGIVRRYPAIAGSALSWLYFTNSIGASAGVLISGFVLIDKFGLPGTLLTAALINFVLALGVYVLVRATDDPEPSTAQNSRGEAVAAGATPGIMLAAAFLTGAASFFYEIGWLRMLSLVLGSSTHAFELMLSAFIFGLAAGAFWIRNRIDAQDNPLRLLGWIQVFMATAALLTLSLYLRSFEGMAWFAHAAQTNADGYVLFNLFCSSLCFGLMLPATFFAGMTLPLMTATMLRNGHGEASIGRIYAANTVGAIAGILLAVHLIMPVLGLRQVIVAGALIDLLLGLWLLRRAIPQWNRMQGLAVGLLVLFASGIVLSVKFDPAVTASGPYRSGSARLTSEMLFHADGKTATVDVSRIEGIVSIATNGKIDAGRRLDGIAAMDDYTMGMLGLLPMAMHPQAKTAAVIGMGSGTSADLLLRNSRLQSVDIVEIEPAMVEGARQFSAVTHRVYEDPRSRIHIEDAKTYFARTGAHYDLILSEPSNPWVSGVASLFSREFYAQVKRYLNSGGLFVQWMHLYEIDLTMVATVMNALGENFEDYAIYSSNNGDIIIVAKPSGKLPPLSPWIFSDPGLSPILQSLSFAAPRDLEWRSIGGKSSLAPYFLNATSRSNSDYFPVLDQRAARQRFMNGNAYALLQIHPYSMRLEQRSGLYDTSPLVPGFVQLIPGIALNAKATADYFLNGAVPSGWKVPDGQMKAAAILTKASGACTPQALDEMWLSALEQFVIDIAYYLPAATTRQVVEKLRHGPCAAQLDDTGRAWIDLLEGIGERHPGQVQASIPRLMAVYKADSQVISFLMAELLLADLQTGGAHAALERLSKIHGVPESAPLTYLSAYAAANDAPAKGK